MVPQIGVEQALQALRARAQASSEQQRHARAAALEQSLRQHSPAGHTPSGPRRKGEGVDDAQGLLAAQQTPTGGASLRISLLAAGFVCGPSGISVRGVIDTTGADIRSWSEMWAGDAYGGHGGRPLKCRTFIIEGKRREVIHAIGIISAAVERYAELCGGAFSGQAVDRTQVIDSVQFFYSPPPRAAVPYAASLRGHDKDPSPPARKSLGFASPRTSAGKENAVGSGGITPRSASALRAHAAPFAGGLPATPPAPHGVGGPHSALSLLPSLPEHMSLAVGDGRAEPSAGCGGVADSPLQCTPSYSTSHAAPARAHSLFGSGGGLAATAGLQYPEAAPFTGGGSFLLSAFEQASTPFLYPAAPPAAAGVERFLVFGGAADAVLPAATPSVPLEQLHRQSSLGSMQVDGLLHRQLSGGGGQMDFSVGGMGPLHRQLSGEDSVLAACGFPAFSTFAQQSQAYFQPSLFEPPAQPVQPPGAATDGGAAHWWEPADAHMQHTQLPATFGLF